LEINKIYLGDSFELDSKIEDKSIDLILEDMPYNVTACKWDIKIDLKQYWESRLRILKPAGCIALTAIQPFASELIMSNREYFKYEWIWGKNKYGNFLNTKFVPMRAHENVLIFYKGTCKYNPIKRRTFHLHKKTTANNRSTRTINITGKKAKIYGGKEAQKEKKGMPITIIKIDFEKNLFISNAKKQERHPTQKPVKLFEYLIRTYTNENDLVFDGFAGSGTTGVAAINCKRNFICIEKERKYFELAEKRIEIAQSQLKLNF